MSWQRWSYNPEVLTTRDPPNPEEVWRSRTLTQAYSQAVLKFWELHYLTWVWHCYVRTWQKQNRNNHFGDFYIFLNLTYQSYIRYLIHWHFLGPPTSPNFDSHEKLFLIRFGIIPYCNTYFFYFCSLFLIQKFFQLWNFLI